MTAEETHINISVRIPTEWYLRFRSTPKTRPHTKAAHNLARQSTYQFPKDILNFHKKSRVKLQF